MRKSTVTTMLLIAAIVAIVGIALIVDSGRSGDEERFVGTDSAATSRIEEDHPDYQPWFQSVFAPTSSEVESGLFALQAAVGGTVLGYTIGALRGRRRNDSATTATSS
ncbi:energy-coupling factor ABC transporter substrate-binding protein [Rhodococcus sp. KRD162]|uniref:energy-coupling factor ABC transporter substrate-binding protein n=1 Tax=Rhodococcus sp. KRD162 TaxID=2729725 RepID=UPI0019CF9EC6|nr:energy-coupling factor ABC transporter substrate-binding protein [Rhodococcus sp. KRD162]